MSEGVHQWTTHESVKREVETALMWLEKCEAERTDAYVHDAVGTLAFLPNELDHLASELDRLMATAQAKIDRLQAMLDDVEAGRPARA